MSEGDGEEWPREARAFTSPALAELPQGGNIMENVNTSPKELQFCWTPFSEF